MPRVFSVDEFDRRARELVEKVGSGGETVVIQDQGGPVAILTSHRSAVAMASMVDLPRWEEWIEEMRETFPEAAARLGKMRERAKESPEVENFSVIAATKGRDAMAEAMIELSLAGTTVVGAGASTNAIEAGVHAYLNALNFLVEAGATETTAGASS